MPKIYEYIGYIFYFYSNKHTPVHCHIEKGGKVMKVDLIYIHGTLFVRFLKVKRAPQFVASEKEEIGSFIKARHLEIVKKWETFFVLGKKPTFEKIKVKFKKVNESESLLEKQKENNFKKDKK